MALMALMAIVPLMTYVYVCWNSSSLPLMALMALVPLMTWRETIVIYGSNGINGISSINDVCLHMSEFFVINIKRINGISSLMTWRETINDVCHY